MELQTFCRTCFEVGHFYINGYEVNVNGNEVPIEKMIQRFSNIAIKDGSGPEMICETCTHELVQSYMFTEKIQKADERILNMFCTEPQDVPIVYEEDTLVQKYAEEDAEEEEETIQSSSEIEERFTDEYDATDENTDSHIVEEFFIDADCPQEQDDIISVTEALPVKRKYNRAAQIVLTEGVSNLLSNYDINEGDPDEPKRKVYCRKKDRRYKEVDERGSFVITQFTPSAASKMQMESLITDDNDEVALSDIRTMNFETVEVNAGNMNVISEEDQGELPIDDTRIYLCQYCPKAFSSSPFLISHVRKSHGCKYCAKMFGKSAELYKHIREEHSTFKCVVCEKDFVSNSNLRNHLKTVHKLKVPANVSLLSYKRNERCSEAEDEVLSS